MLGENAGVLKKAQQHLAQGRPQQAEELFRQLLSQANAIDFEYNEWLDGAARTYRTLSRDREAGYIYIYLGRLDRARDLFPRDTCPVDAARVLELQARPLLKQWPDRAAPLFAEAAGILAGAGHNVLAALSYVDAGDLLRARQRWERVLAELQMQERDYERGLVHFNLGMLARRAGDKAAGGKHFVEAQRILEEVADDFEGRGERERAFDCYAVLLQIGKELKSYENLAEGYINCIRVLKEDNLKFYVLQYYEDFLRISLEHEEYHAAATMFREAADYTRRAGLVWDREYSRRAGDTWCLAAEQNLRRGGPVKLTENAFLAAIDSFNGIADFPRVREVYRRLSELKLSERTCARYRLLMQRYAETHTEPQEESPSFPEYLRHQHAYPDIWHLDLIEWEYAGDPAAVCASIVGDVKYADMVRRRALFVLLLHLDRKQREQAPAQAGDGGLKLVELRVSVLSQIAHELGQMTTYNSLRPLERLYEDADPRVRRAAIDALRCLCYKRTFPLLVRGLHDADEGVREAALRSMKDLHFPNAVDPLSRIYREHEDLKVKAAALESLGRVGDLSAGEFLIDVLRHGEDSLQDVARRLLSRYDNPDILPILRRHRELATGRTRDLMEGVLRGR